MLQNERLNIIDWPDRTKVGQRLDKDRTKVGLKVMNIRVRTGGKSIFKK